MPTPTHRKLAAAQQAGGKGGQRGGGQLPLAAGGGVRGKAQQVVQPALHEQHRGLAAHARQHAHQLHRVGGQGGRGDALILLLVLSINTVS